MNRITKYALRWGMVVIAVLVVLSVSVTTPAHSTMREITMDDPGTQVPGDNDGINGNTMPIQYNPDDQSGLAGPRLSPYESEGTYFLGRSNSAHMVLHQAVSWIRFYLLRMGS